MQSVQNQNLPSGWCSDMKAVMIFFSQIFIVLFHVCGHFDPPPKHPSAETYKTPAIKLGGTFGNAPSPFLIISAISKHAIRRLWSHGFWSQGQSRGQGQVAVDVRQVAGCVLLEAEGGTEKSLGWYMLCQSAQWWSFSIKGHFVSGFITMARTHGMIITYLKQYCV